MKYALALVTLLASASVFASVETPSANDILLYEAVLNRCVGKTVGNAKVEDLPIWEKTFGQKNGTTCYILPDRSQGSNVGANVECGGKKLKLVKYYKLREDCLAFKKNWQKTVASH